MPTAVAVALVTIVVGPESVIQLPGRHALDAAAGGVDARFYTQRHMRLLDAFATAFINTFGITQPIEAQRRRASWFIAALMVLTIAIVALIGYAFYVSMHR
jgi:hypothetical protein